MDTAVLVLRTALSLGVVLGLIWYAGRRFNDAASGNAGDGPVGRLLGRLQGTAPRRTGSAPAGRRGRRGGPLVDVTVVGRQAVGPKATVTVVDVGGQRLVLGVSEAGVSVLSTLEVPDAFDAVIEGAAAAEAAREKELVATGEVREEIDVDAALAGEPAPTARASSALDQSILSPATWRQALDVMQGRTVRR